MQSPVWVQDTPLANGYSLTTTVNFCYREHNRRPQSCVRNGLKVKVPSADRLCNILPACCSSERVATIWDRDKWFGSIGCQKSCSIVAFIHTLYRIGCALLARSARNCWLNKETRFARIFRQQERTEMGQPEQSAGTQGQGRDKKNRRSRKKGQKPAEKAGDKQGGRPEDDLGEGAATAGGSAAKGRRRRDKAGATAAKGQEVSPGKGAAATPQDGGVQTPNGAGRESGRDRNGTGSDRGGHTAPAAGREEGAPVPGEAATPAGEPDQQDKAGSDQKRRRNKKSKESKLLVYRRLGEYMPEEDEKKVDEVLSKRETTEMDDKSKMAAGVDGAGDVAAAVQSPTGGAATGALATNGPEEGEGEDSYYSILAQLQETVEQAAETLSPAAEGGVKVELDLEEDSPGSFEAILKFAAAMEMPTSRNSDAGTGQVSSSGSRGPKDSRDVDTAISHVAEKEAEVGEDMEAAAEVQGAETPGDMSSDGGDRSPQTNANVNDTGAAETEPKSTEEEHSAGSRVGSEESCEESNIPAPPESCSTEVTQIDRGEVPAQQDTEEQDAPPATSAAEDPGRAEAEPDQVSDTTDTDATSPAVELTTVIPSAAEAETFPDTPEKPESEDDTTEAVSEEDLLLNAEEGDSIAITLPRHLSEEVESAADMGNKPAKQNPATEQPDSKQEAVDDATGPVFDDDAVADTSTSMSPDNQSNLPTSDAPPANQTSEDEVEVEVTVPNEPPGSQEDAGEEEEEPTEVPNYTPPPPADAAIPEEEARAQPKPQEKAIVIGNAATLPDDIPYIDGVDEPAEEGPDAEAQPARATETTPLTTQAETAPVKIPKVEEEEALIETPEPTREDEPSTTPGEKQKKKKKRSKLFSCMFPCVQPQKEKNH
ncbi:hypothetical protein Bbelb_165500 [Branchiostoma belcheri]|nr:hypothetical protein Bbelb_165500 [Branchiostoma belcheri]